MHRLCTGARAALHSPAFEPACAPNRTGALSKSWKAARRTGEGNLERDRAPEERSQRPRGDLRTPGPAAWPKDDEAKGRPGTGEYEASPSTQVRKDLGERAKSGATRASPSLSFWAPPSRAPTFPFPDA